MGRKSHADIYQS